jgi:hypothetical protein
MKSKHIWINILTVSILLIEFSGVRAQSKRPNQERIEKRQDRVMSMRIGYITEKLDLTPPQSEKFWPIYNKFSDERKAIVQEIRKQNQSQKSENDQQILNARNEVFKLKSKEIELEKKYQDEFLKVISTKQYAALLQAERDFNKMLLEKLKEKRGKEIKN